MQPGLATRAAAVRDADAIASLLTGDGYPARAPDVLERLSRFDSVFSTVRVAELDGRVVGVVAMHVIPRLAHSDRIARVLTLSVDGDSQCDAVRQRLISDAEGAARATGCTFVEIAADAPRSAALQVFHSLGYVGDAAAYLRKRI